MRSSRVVGIGNILLTDQGVGVHVVSYLEQHHPAVGVIYMDGWTLSFPKVVWGPLREAADGPGVTCQGRVCRGIATHCPETGSQAWLKSWSAPHAV